MQHVTFSDLRLNLERFLDEAVEGRAPVVITRAAGQGRAVLIAEEELEGLQETLHLLRSPANATRLLRSVEAADSGRYQEHALFEPE